MVWTLEEDQVVVMRKEESEDIDKQILSALPLGAFATLFLVGGTVHGSRRHVVGLENLQGLLRNHRLSLG